MYYVSFMFSYWLELGYRWRVSCSSGYKSLSRKLEEKERKMKVDRKEKKRKAKRKKSPDPL